MIICCLFGLLACKETTTQTNEITMQTDTNIKPISKETIQSAVIYEANIRQYSPEGSFAEFTKDIPQLKQLGVKVIWLMPVFPISEVKRKAYGDLMVEDIEDPEERKKYLGSYYAVSDFKAINPEFGTLDDFRALVQTAHDHDMYVILDWVPNHTGWDHYWITEKPEYYTKNAKGEITDPLNPDGTPVGWEDVADLNYDNMELQEEMIQDMLYWVEKEQIDGFRCDMAGMVPTSFWEKAIPRLRAAKDIFMLAEADKPELTKGELFEMAYGWKVHHLMNDIAKGHKNATDFDAYMNHYFQKWEEDDILMHFVTNHDENSWAGYVQERMGAAAPALLSLTYSMPGMPLIYSGQEYDLDKRLKFFEKDSIPKQKGNTWALLEKLGAIKSSRKALHTGKDKAGYQRIQCSDNVNILAFKRSKEADELIYVANLSGNSREATIELDGTYNDLLTGKSYEFTTGKTLSMTAWEHLILSK